MKAIVYDTETTDLISNSALPLEKMPNTIEFYGALLEEQPDGSWEQIDDLELLIKPPYPITAEITKITSITNEMVKDCHPIKDVFNQIVDIFKRADIMVAHNLTYDKNVIFNEARRTKTEIQFPSWEICTVEISEGIFGRRVNLNDLHELLFGERFQDAHRAKHDVQATIRVFKKFWEDGEI